MKGSSLSRAEMVDRAAALTPRLAARADEVEKTRVVHPDTVKDLWDTQLWTAVKPARYGGLELDYGVFIDLSDHIARGCASTAWVYGNLVSHDWMLAMWDSRAQDEVWGDNPKALIASSLVATAGKAKPVPGGYEISGRWPYCSGIDISDWMMMAAMIEDEDPRRPIWLVLPRASFEEVDTWHVSGLVGTGSRDVKCDGVFVPERMTLFPGQARGGCTPGSTHVPNLLYQLPVLGLFPQILVGPMIGIAQGAYDDYVADMRERVSTYNATRLVEYAQLQMRVAEASTLIKAARLLAHDNIREAENIAQSGRIPTVVEKTRWRRDGAYAAQNCVKSIQIMQTAIGAAGIYQSNPFQRRFRDMHAAASQIQVSFDINGAEFGRVELGLEAINRLI
ncbi:MAG: acyl-CoA dehydrogenase family protein [Pseudomonadota bacterium]|nr:acyl-CoA dehydrogenase family protein [Pseudomonadota bacterium]